MPTGTGVGRSTRPPLRRTHGRPARKGTIRGPLEGPDGTRFANDQSRKEAEPMVRACHHVPASRIVALLLFASGLLPGCGIVPRSRMDECQKLSQLLRSENARLKDRVLSLQSQNRDYADRAGQRPAPIDGPRPDDRAAGAKRAGLPGRPGTTGCGLRTTAGGPGPTAGGRPHGCGVGTFHAWQQARGPRSQGSRRIRLGKVLHDETMTG